MKKSFGLLFCAMLTLTQAACVRSRECVDRVYWVNRTSHDLLVTIFASESNWRFSLSKSDSILIWEDHYSISIYPKWREPQYCKPPHETPVRNICNRGSIDSLEISDLHDKSQILRYTINNYYQPLHDYYNYSTTDDYNYYLLITDELCATMRGECFCDETNDSFKLELTTGKISRIPWYGFWSLYYGAKSCLLSDLAIEYQIEELEVSVSGSGHVVTLPNLRTINCLDDYHIEVTQ